MGKLPAFQFYPADWRKDLGIQSLSYHDRGVWFEMLCLMHESERRGVLLLNGRAMTNEMLARVLGLDIQTVATSLTTLLAIGVASREEETGAIYCRRMVRDESLRKVRTEAGKLGGNPRLVNHTANQNRTPSDSVSDSASGTSELSCTGLAGSEELRLPEQYGHNETGPLNRHAPGRPEAEQTGPASPMQPANTTRFAIHPNPEDDFGLSLLNATTPRPPGTASELPSGSVGEILALAQELTGDRLTSDKAVALQAEKVTALLDRFGKEVIIEAVMSGWERDFWKKQILAPGIKYPTATLLTKLPRMISEKGCRRYVKPGPHSTGYVPTEADWQHMYKDLQELEDTETWEYIAQKEGGETPADVLCRFRAACSDPQSGWSYERIRNELDKSLTEERESWQRWMETQNNDGEFLVTDDPIGDQLPAPQSDEGNVQLIDADI